MFKNSKTVVMQKEKYVFGLMLFIAYVICICWLLFFQVGSTERASYFTSRKIHLIPFESTYNSIKLAINNNFGPPHKTHFRYLTVRNLIGNILLLLPWGLLSPMLFPYFQKPTKILMTAIAFSTCAELTQLIFILGVSDIDDIILNAMGALIGFSIYTYLK